MIRNNKNCAWKNVIAVLYKSFGKIIKYKIIIKIVRAAFFSLHNLICLFIRYNYAKEKISR